MLSGFANHYYFQNESGCKSATRPSGIQSAELGIDRMSKLVSSAGHVPDINTPRNILTLTTYKHACAADIR